MIKKFISDLNHKLNEKRGSVLMTVMIFFLVLVIIIASASYLSYSNFSKSQNNNYYSSAYYVAESGMNQALDTIKTYVDSLSDQQKQQFRNDSDAFAQALSEAISSNLNYGNLMNQPAAASVSLERDSAIPENLILTSSGTVGSSERVLQRTILNFRNILPSEVQPEPGIVVEEAMVVKDLISINGGVINGDIKVLNPRSKSVVISNSGLTFNGIFKFAGSYTQANIVEAFDLKDIANNNDSNTKNFFNTYRNAQTNWQLVVGEPIEGKIETGIQDVSYPIVRFPDIDAIQSSNPFRILRESDITANYISRHLSSDGSLSYSAAWDNGNVSIQLPQYTYIPNINISGTWGTPLTFVVGDQDKTIVTDSLSVDGGIVNVVGTGRLTILVKGSSNRSTFNFNPITFENTTYTNVSDKMKSVVVYAEANQNKTINLSKYGGNTALSLMSEDANISISSHNKSINFVTLGKEVTVTNSSSNFNSELFYAPNATIYYNGNFEGSIIANQIIFQGSGSRITFKAFDYENMPFEIFTPVPDSGSGGNDGGSGSGGEYQIGPLVEV